MFVRKDSELGMLKSLSRISCAMLIQAIRDYKRTTNYYLSDKNWKLAKLWLFNDKFPSKLTLQECCDHINSYLEAIGIFMAHSEGFTPERVRDRLLNLNGDDLEEFLVNISTISTFDSRITDILTISDYSFFSKIESFSIGLANNDPDEDEVVGGDASLVLVG